MRLKMLGINRGNKMSISKFSYGKALIFLLALNQNSSLALDSTKDSNVAAKSECSNQQCHVEITNPTYFCVHKEKTNAILKLITNYANAFVREDIEALKQFFSSDCQEVIKSQAKIFKGRDEVISHIRDILLKTNKNHYKITNFEIKDPCTIFQGSQAIVTFTGIETYTGKCNYKLSAHITVILSKEDGKPELTMKTPVDSMPKTASSANEVSKDKLNQVDFSDYKCILFQMDGWKPYHPKK